MGLLFFPMWLEINTLLYISFGHYPKDNVQKCMEPSLDSKILLSFRSWWQPCEPKGQMVFYKNVYVIIIMLASGLNLE